MKIKKRQIDDLCEKYEFNYFAYDNTAADWLHEALSVEDMDDAEKEVYEALCERRRQHEEYRKRQNPHGAVVGHRFEAYHDVTIYEDGHEEWYNVGD